MQSNSHRAGPQVKNQGNLVGIQILDVVQNENDPILGWYRQNGIVQQSVLLPFQDLALRVCSRPLQHHI